MRGDAGENILLRVHCNSKKNACERGGEGRGEHFVECSEGIGR